MHTSPTPNPPARACAPIAGLLRAIAVVGLLLLPGCAAPGLIGAMGQAWEDQRLIEVLAQYDGLEGRRVAVVVNAGLDVLYEHPDVVSQITGGVTQRIGSFVPETRMRMPRDIVAWQWSAREWHTLPYGKMAELLQVDRVVVIDLQEYRLNPPGNRWLWEGLAAATVGVVEADGFDPDSFAATFQVVAEFPRIKGVESSQASREAIEFGLLAEFIKKTSWLFYTHEEPKYPDRYRPGLDR